MTASADHSTDSVAPEQMARDRDALTTSLIHSTQAVDTVPLAAFPRGAKAGNFFHELLEVIDFAAAPTAFQPAVKAQLQLYRYQEEPWVSVVPRVLEQILATPLNDGRGSFCLRDLPAGRRISELEFALPLVSGPGKASLQTQLAQVFSAGAKEPHELRYAARVGELHLGVISGFVKGFIDLVFEHEGCFFVLDYKTNHLGPTWEHYSQPRLEAAMVDGHYHLQSHLYSLAVSRHLARTVKGYEPAVHFGGVFYLFLRGMGGADRPGTGVYFQPPNLERLRVLEAVFPAATVNS